MGHTHTHTHGGKEREKNTKMSVREWLLEQGGKSGLDTLHIDEQCSDTGRGVRTERRIEQGEAIISIPMEAVLTGTETMRAE